MEDKTERRTALEFETVSPSGLVFESEPLPQNDTPPEEKRDVDISSAEPARVAAKIEVTRDVFESTGSSSELKKTYLPRFTDVSRRYRERDTERVKRGNNIRPTAPSVHNEPEVDPTAELDESVSVNRVVVTSSVSADDAFSDESIKIYKFDNDTPSPTSRIPSAQATEVTPAPKEEIEEDEAPVPEEPDVTEEMAEKTEDVQESIILPSPVREYADAEAPKGSRESVPNSKSKLFPKYTSLAERDGFKDRFLDALMSVRIRFVAIALIFLSLIASEIVFLTVSPYDMGGFLTGGGALVDLIFSTALFALALPEVIRAGKYAAKKCITPELMLPIAYAVILAYSLITAFLGDVGVRYLHFSLPMSILVAFSVLGSYFRLDGEFISFKTVSSGKDMWVLDKRFTRTLDRENIALDGAVDEYSSKLARVFRTSFVSDYTENVAKIRENSANVLTSLGISLGAALVTGAIALFLTDSPARFPAALEAFALVFFFSAPALSLLVHKLPLNRLIRASREKSYTFVGEGSVMDTADVDVIAYDDTEIFGKGGVTIRKVHLYGKIYNTAKAMEEMYSLFSVTKGPLEEVFSESLDRKCRSAESVTVFDDGIVGTFEGHKVMAGSLDFMLRNNAVIPEDDNKVRPDGTENVRVMYGAEDGEVFVKFFIKYSFMEKFSRLLPDLRRERIVPLVYTRDPNIDADMLRLLTNGEDAVRVLKERELPLPNEVFTHISSGEVSLGEKFSVPEMLLSARAYRAHITLLSLTELGVMFAGAAVSSVLSLIFLGGSSAIPSFVPALYQLIPGVSLFVFSSLSFKLPKKDK